MERYFLPVFFPMILIASYGLWIFVKNFPSNKIKIIFFAIFMFSHLSTTLIFWKRLYFEPHLFWPSPVPLSFQESLLNPIVPFLGIVFLISFVVCMIKYKQIKSNDKKLTK